MATFTKVNPGDPIQAHQLDQVIDALIGTAGAGVPLAVTAVNDATNYALTVQNDESGNSRALNVLKSDGSTLIKADASGVTLGAPLNLPTGSITSTSILDGTIQASDLNASLGNFGAGSAWPSIAVAQGATNPTFTTNFSHWLQIGKMVIAQLMLTFTGAGTAANAITLTTLPAAPRNTGSYVIVGNFLYVRSAISFYAGVAVATSTTQVQFGAGGADATNTIAGFLGASSGPSFAVGNADVLSVSLAYEAA